MKAVAVLNFWLVVVLAFAFPIWAGAATHEVAVGSGGNRFSPNDLTIEVGDTVHWTSAGGTHDVVADDNSFSSGSPSSNINFSRTFNSVGEILYYCSVHSSPGRNISSNMNGRITVQSGGGGAADLAVQSVDAQNGTYAPGDLISIDIAIENIGNADSVGYTVTFYASTNSTINSSDTEIGSSNRPALSASQMSNFSVNAAFPNNIADGSYFIGASIEISDANNANNTGVDNTTVTVDTPPPPPAAELVLTEVNAPSASFAQGATISIDAEVDNTGTAASGAFSIDYYASTNNSINAQDRLIGTENRASLEAGEDSSGPFNATIPANLAPGTYFIGAIVDFNDSNSANNINLEQSSIAVTAADAFVINNGLNDTWKNVGTPKQGFFITVFPDTSPGRPQPVMFLAWFTYDVERPAQGVTAMLGEPGHRWLTAFGPYSGDTATLDIELTEGGIFDSAVPAPTQTEGYGTITVKFTSCSEGVVTYNIPSVGVSGTAPITRVANDNVVLCEAFSPP